MSKLISFSDYAEYVRQQEQTDRRKRINSSGLKKIEVKAIVSWYQVRGLDVISGLCHGARHGFEIDWFSAVFPGAEIIGTDLLKRSHPKVVQHDFHETVPEWLGSFDFIYSNSLDHSYCPEKAVDCWSEQLKVGGHLFIQWSTWHIKVRGGDCYGAFFHEYIQLLNKCKRLVVIDVLYHYKEVVTLIARRKN